MSTTAASVDIDHELSTYGPDSDQFVDDYKAVDLDQQSMQILSETISKNKNANSSYDYAESDDRGGLTNMGSITLP